MSSASALSSDRQAVIFEMRLQGGYRSFWSAITPTVYGRSRAAEVPAIWNARNSPLNPRWR
jgi:hypothetical protein